MRKNAIAIACAALVALAIAAPAFPWGSSGYGELAAQPAAKAVQAAGAPAQPADDMQPSPVPADEARMFGAAENMERVAGVVLVGLADGITLDQVNERIAQLDYIATESVSEDDWLFGYVELALAEGVEVDAALQALADEEFAQAAQPDYVYHLLDESWAGNLQAGNVESLELQSDTSKVQVNDPLAEEQWALDAVDAYGAWGLVTCDHRVTVAVLDSGVNMDHEDLKGNLVGAWSVLSNSSDVTDTYGHGTHVAGILAATANNAKGVAGVSYNANVMPVQVMENDGSIRSSDAVKGIRYVIEKADEYNVKVMNVSFGTTDNVDPKSSKIDPLFIKALSQVHDAGILTVYAAGNGGSDGAYNCYPCDFDENGIGAINVRKKDGTFEKSVNSNYNLPGQTSKELSAPGDGLSYSNWIISTTRDGQYGRMHGTSMAAPCVAGVAALAFAANPQLTSDLVKGALCDTALDLGEPGFDLLTGYGLVNARAAVEKAATIVVPVVPTESIFRLYNPNSGEHFYTEDQAERDHLSSVGWIYEGVGWMAPVQDGASVYRLYNRFAGEHHYTLDQEERNMLVKAGWTYEGVGWLSDAAGSVPLYREYNPNQYACNHNYTANADEHRKLISLGWQDEGIGWYGSAQPSDKT